MLNFVSIAVKVLGLGSLGTFLLLLPVVYYTEGGGVGVREVIVSLTEQLDSQRRT